jgi:hypothetical protein
MFIRNFVARAETILREHEQFRINAGVLIRILVLPAHADYECWQVVQRYQPRTGAVRYVGAHGRWDAFRDARELFEPQTGQSVHEGVEPRITWTEMDLSSEFVEELITRLCLIRVPLVCMTRLTVTDGTRYEVHLHDPRGGATVRSSLSWVASVPDEWLPVEALMRETIEGMHRLSSVDVPGHRVP